MLADLLSIERIERQAAGFQFAVVATDAVAIDDGVPVRR
jgi:hypothetical protein